MTAVSSPAAAAYTRRAAIRAALTGVVVIAWPARSRAQGGGTPLWIWAGGVTDGGAVVKAAFGTVPGAAPELLVSRTPDLAGPRRIAPRMSPAPSRSQPRRALAEFVIDDLAPGTEYYYAVASATALRGRFRTWSRGPTSVTVAFASCAGGTRWLPPASAISNSGVFDAIAAASPDLFVHMGDFHYYNITGPRRPIEPLIGRFRDALDTVLAQPRQAALYRRTPIAYMWDDHDYGADESDANSPTRDAARAYYDSDVPHYDLPLSPRADGPITQAFDVGRVRMLITDTRSERVPATGTMLGSAQRAWLLDRLAEAASERVPLVVWVNTVPWITEDGDSQGWGPFADERRVIGQRITELGLGPRLVMLSGDAHMLAMDDGRNNRNGGFPVAHAAPLDRWTRIKGGPYSHFPATQENGQFGVMRVEDTGDAVTVALDGHRYQGNGRSAVVPGITLRLTCTAESCTAAGLTGAAAGGDLPAANAGAR